MKKGQLVVWAIVVIGAGVISKAFSKQIKKVRKLQELASKHLQLFLMMNQWVKVKQDNKNLSMFFEKEGYREIAVYGMHFAGETLVEELFGSNVIVKYGIDKNKGTYPYLDIISPDAKLKEVDAIVVTAITYFDEIKAQLSDKVNCPIISLKDIIYQI